MQLEAVLERVVDAAEEAGRVIFAIRRSQRINVTNKDDSSPVTSADHAADSLLKARLPQIVDAGWLSEETADSDARLGADRVWIVDPLDGTKEFIADVPEYAVAIALVEGGTPVVSVVHNPATGETFAAARGLGLRVMGPDDRAAIGDELLASRSEMRTGEFADFEKAGWTLRAIGSIEYKLALVAAGRAALTLSRGPKWEWDVCAGSLLVEEAGGMVTDMYGERLSFNQPFPKTRGVLAGGHSAHARAMTLLAGLGPSERMRELIGPR